MNILHTSDWHLGLSLFGRKRDDESEAFLAWLIDTLDAEHIDVLLVSGDIFDSGAPSNRARTLYYRFLARVRGTGCRHVIITAGNHDSPSFLEAPREILDALSITVVGQAATNPEDDVLLLSNGDGQPELIVCAAPFLRERDMRSADATETIAERGEKLAAGIATYYGVLAQKALAMQKALDAALPVVAMGHLFVSGGIHTDGMRDLYVGNLGQIHADIFSNAFDYVALGHIHSPMTVAGKAAIRYCGSPLAVGFGEAGQQKFVNIVSFDGKTPAIRPLAVPVFVPLVRIRGDFEAIEGALATLVKKNLPALVDVTYDDTRIQADLRERLLSLVDNSPVDILRIQTTAMTPRLTQSHPAETLADLAPDEVFLRCLADLEIPADQKEGLVATFHEALGLLHAREMDDDKDNRN